MLYPLFTQLVDEVAANLMLHLFVRHRRRDPVHGPAPEEQPALFSGELDRFFAPSPDSADLLCDVLPVADRMHSSVRDYRFPSATATRWPENDTVWCRHWKTKAPDCGLTVVGVDGIVQLGSGWFRRLAEHLSPRGIDVLMMDAPFNYRRTPRGYRPGQLILNGDVGHQLAVTRQAVLDLWRIIVSFQQQGRRVGLVGVSYGGWLSSLATLLADELEFLIALVPPVNIVDMVRQGSTLIRGLRRGLGYDMPPHNELDRIVRPVVPLRWQPKLPGNRITLHAARYDRFVPCRGIEELSRTWGTKLVLHNEAHYRLAVSPKTTPIVAEEILSRWANR